jgi:hypothetical protein
MQFMLIEVTLKELEVKREKCSEDADSFIEGTKRVYIVAREY